MSPKGLFFPVRPKPFDEEGFTGYVLRIADRNGRSNLNELCLTIGMISRKSNYVVGHPYNSLFIETCAAYLKRCPVELSDSFSGLTQQHLHDEQRLIRDISIANPKLCPHCMQENGFFKADWQVAHVTHCRKHSVMLLDACPRCDATFKWDCDLFEKCQKCAVKWKDLKPALSPVPKYQHMKNEDAREMLIALYAALLFTFRPYDLMFDSLQTLQIDNDTLHRHFLQAHSLLTDQKFRSEWLLNYPSTQFYPMHNKQPLNEYLKRLAEVYSEHTHVQEHAIKVEKHEIQSVVRTPRLALASCPEDLNFQIGLIGASECLGLSGNELVELIGFGHITALNSPRMQRDILFDVRNLNTIPQRLYARAGSISSAGEDRLVPLNAILGKLKHFSMNRAQLINVLLTTPEIALFSDQKTGQWQDVKANEKTLFCCLKLFSCHGCLRASLQRSFVECAV
ncbi:TniQ family protein [Amphritea pacifica]|uniref:TniQ family protein n=1 Tax=Amphritea pacifica TaxID=2811233 RepID=A0ABS2WCX5_9GAMM|nr:TniQ family protein [Amphritea pacifica]MBN0989367.1 TniQ family protein [Amphritea pacifica]